MLRIIVKKWIVGVSVLCFIPLLSAQAQLSMGPDMIHRGTTIEIIQPGNFTLQSIVDSITDEDANNPYLIKLGPGVYNSLGPNSTTGLTMKPFVSIMGSGQGVTFLQGAISSLSISSATSAIILGADNMVISHLSIENFGFGSTYSIGITNISTSPRIENVTTMASGAQRNYGIRNAGSTSSPTMNNITTTGHGGGSSSFGYGVRNDNGASPIMNNIIATALAGTNTNYGVYNTDGSSAKMNNVTTSASGGTTAYGVRNALSSSPTMNNVTATASDATSLNYGVRNESSSSPTMYNVIATATGPSGSSSYGVLNLDSNTAPKINYSFLSGDSAGLDFGSAIGTRVTYTQVVGGISNNPVGTLQCRGVFNENLSDITC